MMKEQIKENDDHPHQWIRSRTTAGVFLCLMLSTEECHQRKNKKPFLGINGRLIHKSKKLSSTWLWAFFAQGNTNSFANSFKASFISSSLQNTTTLSLFKVVSGIRTILASPDLVTNAFSEIGTVWRGGKEILHGLPPQHCIDDQSCVAKDRLFKTTHAWDDIFA